MNLLYYISYLAGFVIVNISVIYPLQLFLNKKYGL